MALAILLQHTGADKPIGLQITTQPTTRTYTVNSSGTATFNFSGAVVQLVYKSGKLETVTPSWYPTSYSITDTTTSRSVSVIATYGDFTASTIMTVNNPLASIAITTQPTTRTYTVNSSGNAVFSFTGAVITATYTNGATKTVTPSWSPTSGNITNTSTSSTVTVTASYTDAGVTKTATTTMTLNNPITSIAITTQPTTRTYTVNSSGNATFDFSGAIVTATYTNGATKTVTPTWAPTTGSITNTSTSTTVTVTASSDNKSATTTMTLNNPLVSLSVSPSSTTYNQGATTAGTVTATYTNGKTASVSAARSPATAASTTTSVTFSYGGKTVVQTVTNVMYPLPASYTGTWNKPSSNVSFSTANNNIAFNMTNYAGLTNAQLYTNNISLKEAGYNYLRFNVSGLSLGGNSVALVGCCNSNSTVLGYLDVDTANGVGQKITSTGTKAVNISSLSTGKFTIALWGSTGNAQITLSNCYLSRT